jgi:asparagine synthase (glutamine-hydrolysing)
MPGIVGLVSHEFNLEGKRLVNSMVDSMRHEGSYQCGTHFVPEMGIYVGWVAQEGSFAAGQVFLNERKDIALLFSGECFIDSETRAALKAKGHNVGTALGDAVVHLYEEEGEEQFFQQLNGLFSGLLIDKRSAKTFLFNDRYGVERIYWHEGKDGIYFASEAKALLRILPQARAFDDEGVDQFLTFGCTLEGRTLFKGIRLLPGASLWCFERTECRKRTYFSPTTWEAQSPLSPESFQCEFEETVQRVLPRYFQSQSAIGISLTAGLDGRMIMACLPQLDPLPVCYTFSGQRRATLDARLAARVAEVCGLEHQTLRLAPDFFSDFPTYVDRTVNVTDGCVGPFGAHEIYFNRSAGRLAPVRVTGVFGGEILRGVSAFKPIGISPRLVNRNLSGILETGKQRRSSRHPLSFAAFYEIPHRRYGIPAASRSQVTFRTPYLDNDMVALAYKLPAMLRTSPAPALRLINSRSPALAAIPTDMGEMGSGRMVIPLLRRAFSKATFKLDYLYREGLPGKASLFNPLFARLSWRMGIAGIHKFLNYRSWFQNDLAPYVIAVLSDTATQGNSFWNSEFLNKMASELKCGRGDYAQEIDVVLTLEAVERLLLRGASEKTA